MSVVVFGGNGFIGRHLVNYLKAKEISVEVISGRSDGISGPDCFSAMTMELLSTKKPDCIFYLPGVRYEDSYSHLVNVNVSRLVQLLDMLSLQDWSKNSKIFVVGSAAEYGYLKPSEFPAKESFSTFPTEPYGVTKLCQTLLALNWGQRTGRHVTVLRPFSVIGPGMPVHVPMGNFVHQIRDIISERREPVLAVGALNVSRDFTDVKDLVRLMWLLAQAENSSGRIVNICSGQPVSLGFLLQVLLSKAGVTAMIKESTGRKTSHFMPEHYGDNSVLRSLVGNPLNLSTYEESITRIVSSDLAK